MAILFQQKSNLSEIQVVTIDQKVMYYYEKIDFTDFDYQEFKKISHEKSKIQWLASRYLLKQMIGFKNPLHIQKSKSGKPNFVNHRMHFSITHSQDKVGVIISKTNIVAIDIEEIQPKIITLKRKFLHQNDYCQTDDPTEITLIWSAKECIFKYFDRPHLSFRLDIAIVRKESNIVAVEVNQKTILVHYLCFDSYILTWIDG